jgi:hypothetical protein
MEREMRRDEMKEKKSRNDRLCICPSHAVNGLVVVRNGDRFLSPVPAKKERTKRWILIKPILQHKKKEKRKEPSKSNIVRENRRYDKRKRENRTEPGYACMHAWTLFIGYCSLPQ